MKLIHLFLPIFILSSTCQAQKSAITFVGGGRLGDKLYNYCKARWLAYKHNLIFLCPQFPLKETMLLDELELTLSNEIEKMIFHNGEKGVFQIKRIKNETEITPNQGDTLYICDLRIKPKCVTNETSMVITFNKNPEFLLHIRSCIATKEPTAQLTLPIGVPTIAVHVRRGGGYDRPLLHQEKKLTLEYADKEFPTRFPPDKYYIDQIKRVASLFKQDQYIYVHLFTDDKDPEKMAEKYTKALALPNIKFGYRSDNNHKEHVLDDLFAMTQFDYLIRPSSKYSLIAMILGNHKLSISPKHATWYDDYLSIDVIRIVERHDDGSMTRILIDTPEQ